MCRCRDIYLYLYIALRMHFQIFLTQICKLTCAALERMGTLQMSVASLFSCVGQRFLSLPGMLTVDFIMAVGGVLFGIICV